MCTHVVAGTIESICRSKVTWFLLNENVHHVYYSSVGCGKRPAYTLKLGSEHRQIKIQQVVPSEIAAIQKSRQLNGDDCECWRILHIGVLYSMQSRRFRCDTHFRIYLLVKFKFLP